MDNKDTSIVHSFDEAMTIAGNGKFQGILFVVTGICLMSIVIETSIVGFYATVARCDLGFTLSQQGMLTSAAFFGIVVMSYPWGYISDTIGRRKVIIVSMIAGFIASIISAFSNSVWMLTALRFIVGVFVAGTQVSVFSYLGEFHSAQTRAKAVTLLTSFVSLALSVLPALAIGILPLKFSGEIYGKPFSSWRILGITSTMLTLLSAIVLSFLPESPKFLLTAGHPEKAIEALQFTFRMNKGLPRDKYPVLKLAADNNGGKPTKDGFLGRMKHIFINTSRIFERSCIFTSLNLLFQMFGIFMVAQGLYMWFPSILLWMAKHTDENLTLYEITQLMVKNKLNASHHHQSSCDISKKTFTYEALAIMGIIYTLAQITLGCLIKTVGTKRLLGISLLVSGTAGITLCWAKGFYLSLILFMIFFGAGNAAGIVCSIVIDYYPTQISALAMCLVMLIGRCGVVLGSNISGLLIVTNCNVLFYGLGSFIILLAVLSHFLPCENDVKNVVK